MEKFVNVAWSGVWLGSAYGALAVALVLSFRCARVVNMSVGAVFVFAALLAEQLQSGGLAAGLAAACAVVGAVVLTGAQEQFVLRRIATASPQILLLGTLAVAIVLSGVTAVLFGRDPVTGPGLTGEGSLDIGYWHARYDALAIVVGVALATLACWRLFETTRAGKAITAIGVDAPAAEMLGIDVWRWRLVAMAYAGLLAGVAGVLFLPLGVLDFSQGLSFTL